MKGERVITPKGAGVVVWDFPTWGYLYVRLDTGAETLVHRWRVAIIWQEA